MKLKRVSLSNYRGIRKANPELGSRLTLLVGENGSGKSAILQAIAVRLGEVLTHLPGVSGIGFRRSGDIHQQAGRLALYARITLECTDGLIWDRSQATTRQTLPEWASKPCSSSLMNRFSILPIRDCHTPCLCW